MKMNSSEQEFARIIREHKATIYTVCYMFSKDKEEVEDLFQEALIALWRGFEKFRGECNIRSWIYRVSLNTCISAERKKRRQADSVRLDMSIDLFSDTDEDSRQAQMLRERIGRLGVFDRAIILLWLENLSYEEIGAIVGITAKNVSVRLVRIREQLKNMSND
ncbi:MAG: sigma-70 family RNA polymerase sigma factor [Rikenellaceae bacterium]|nr:sigma-70 family RNA polymerase sigma factor [Rikenellaceae bacterium]